MSSSGTRMSRFSEDSRTARDHSASRLDSPVVIDRPIVLTLLDRSTLATSEDSTRANQPAQPTGGQFKTLEQPDVVSSDSYSGGEALSVWMQTEPGEARPWRQTQIGYVAFLPAANIERDEDPGSICGMSNRVQRRSIEREAEGGWRRPV